MSECKRVIGGGESVYCEREIFSIFVKKKHNLHPLSLSQHTEFLSLKLFLSLSPSLSLSFSFFLILTHTRIVCRPSQTGRRDWVEFRLQRGKDFGRQSGVCNLQLLSTNDERRTTGGGWKGDGGGGQGEIHQLDWSKKKKKKASSGLGENPFLRKRLTEVSCKMLNFWIAVKFCLS